MGWHNAKKAHSGIVNIVGEHATYHIAYAAPLTADIEGVAAPMSHWVDAVEKVGCERGGPWLID